MKKLFFQIILPVVAIAGILGFITVLNPIKITNASSQVFGGGLDSCNLVHVTAMNDSSCTSANNPYTSSITLVSNDGKAHAISPLFQSFWCGPGDPRGDGVNPNACLSHESDNMSPVTIPASGQITISAPGQSSTSHGFTNACGVYQADFSFTINNTSCRFGWSATDPNPNHPVMAASFCDTQTSCTLPTHHVCQNNACVVVSGAGSDSCTNNSNCQPPVKDCDGDFDNSPTSDCVVPTLVCGTGHIPDCPAPMAGCHYENQTQCSCGQLVCPTTPTPSNTPSPTMIPTATPTGVNTNNCDNTTQVGNGNNNNCNQNNNNNSSNSNSSSNQNQSQTQNNNQTVNITLGNGQQQQQQQQVLAAATTPTQLPSTGAAGDVLFGLLALIPVGWKIRKLV